MLVCLPSGVKKDTAKLSRNFKIRPYHSCTVLTLLAASEYKTTTSKYHYSVKCQCWFAYPLESKRTLQSSVETSKLDPITPVLCSLDWLPVTTRLQHQSLITLLSVNISLLTTGVKKNTAKLSQSFRIRLYHSCTVLTLLAASDYYTTTSRSHYSVKCQYWFAYPLESKRTLQSSVKASKLDPITPVLCSLDWLPVTTRLQHQSLITLLSVNISLLTTGVKKNTAKLSQSFRIRPYHSCTVLTLLAASDYYTTTSRSHYSVKCQYWFAYPLESKRTLQSSVKASKLDPITPVLCSLDWLPVTTRLQDLITLLNVNIGLLTLWSQNWHCKAQSKLQN